MKTIKFKKWLLLIVALLIAFYIGVGYGQAITYDKLNDEYSLDDVYKIKQQENRQ